jgi:hypothetical protein
MVLMELIISIYIRRHKNGYLVNLPKEWRITGCNGCDPCVILASALILERVRSNEHSISLFSVPTHQHATILAPSLNIYKCRFKFRPQLSTIPFLFLLYPKITEISTARADKARHGLLTADVNYANLDDNVSQDDFAMMSSDTSLHKVMSLWILSYIAFISSFGKL